MQKHRIRRIDACPHLAEDGTAELGEVPWRLFVTFGATEPLAGLR
jgi:hypothetical protein